MDGNGRQGQGGPMVRREHFGGHEVATQQETAAMAVAAQAKAAVEARWIVAMRQPRSMDQVRGELLRECQRPSFAEAAIYRKPIGKGIEGLSIRFVEQALQVMANVDTEAITIYDDADKRIIEVRVTDLERNICHRKQITVSKTVERNRLRDNQNAIGRRTGSNGQTVYIVQATDDDLLNKEAALVSKALRTCGLRLIPGWLQDEAEQAIRTTAANRAAQDPDMERRRLADAFATLNVMAIDLEEYLGHDLGKVSPAELVELREVYTTIRDGQATWQDTIEHRRDQRRGDDPEGPQADTAEPAPKVTTKGAQAVKDKLAAKAKTKAQIDGEAAADRQLAKERAAQEAAVEAEAARLADESVERMAADTRSSTQRLADEAAERLLAEEAAKKKAEAARKRKARADAKKKAKAEAAAKEAAELAQKFPGLDLDGTGEQVKLPDPPAPATAQLPLEPPHNPDTGEVTEEPEWMKPGYVPPPDEEF